MNLTILELIPGIVLRRNYMLPIDCMLGSSGE